MADKRAEQTIVEELRNARPDWGMLLEEGGEIEGNPDKPRWIVDPLDGTTNFLHGVPHFSISIAVEEKKPGGGTEITQGLVYQPLTDESFWAEKGRGAWLNERRLRVSARARPRRMPDRHRHPALRARRRRGMGEDLRRGRPPGRGHPPLRLGRARSRLGRGRADGRLLGRRSRHLGHRGGRAAGQGSGRVRHRLSRRRPVVRAARISRRRRRRSTRSCTSWSPGRSGDRPLRWPPRPARQPQTVLTIDPKHRLVEGVASDGTTIWVSSILDRQILACRTDLPDAGDLAGAGFTRSRSPGTRSRKRLWVAADCPPGVAGDQAVRARRADRRSIRAGRIQTRIAPAVGQLPSRRRLGFRRPACSSATARTAWSSGLLPSGTAFDGRQSARATARAGRGRRSTPDGKQLIVADYSRGIGAVDLATCKPTLAAAAGRQARCAGSTGWSAAATTYYGHLQRRRAGPLVVDHSDRRRIGVRPAARSTA